MKPFPNLDTAVEWLLEQRAGECCVIVGGLRGSEFAALWCKTRDSSHVSLNLKRYGVAWK